MIYFCSRLAEYKPPSCEFNRVVMNLTVVSEGVQYDRLAIMYLGDIEVWRTSTAEPKSHPGISWSYWKDMTNYLSLWKTEQKLIFDLGNTVNEQYTGAFNATLTATFFSTKVAGKDDKHEPAQVIMPISAKKSDDDKGSAFNYPSDEATVKVTLPKNTVRAIVSISATGQSDEEFWQTNVPDSLKSNATGYFAKSAFREARVLIDDQVAGLAWPFPVVFTGGLSPPLHRPLVGIQAFDLLENEIDITPWLGILCDGSEHSFGLQIVSEGEQNPGSYWLLSGKVFAWLDKNSDKATSGSAPTVNMSPLMLELTGSGDKGSPIVYTQSATRDLELSADLEISGKRQKYGWKQRFSMRNSGNITNSGNDQYVKAAYEGESTATKGTLPYFYLGFRYPFEMDLTSTNANDSLKMSAELTQGMDLTVTGKSAFSYGIDAFANRLDSKVAGSALQTKRKSTASFYQNHDGSKTSGESESHQLYKFGGRSPTNLTSLNFSPTPLLYSRDVTVMGDKRVKDDVFVYHSTYEATPEKLSVGKFVDGFAPLPNPKMPGTGKFVGKDDAVGAGALAMSETIQWEA